MAESDEHILETFIDELREKQIFDELDAIGRELHEVTRYFDFETERINIGRGYGKENGLIHVSKAGIKAVIKWDRGEIDHCRKEFDILWEELEDLDMPDYKKCQFLSEAGQEIVEFYIFCLFFRLLTGSLAKKIVSVADITPQKLYVTPQAWLHGVGDAISELGKTTINLLVDLPDSDEFLRNVIVIRKRFLKIAGILYELLDQFETAYGPVINNSQRRGFGNTFRGILFRVSNIIFLEKKELVGDRTKLAVIEAMRKVKIS